jgi:HEXXH motif-containing protein
MDTAWTLLGQVQAVAPEAFELVLMHPYTGSWLAYTHKLLTGLVVSDSPLWTHLGYFHCLAASAAARAELDFRIRIPVWKGEAILPTLGMARFAGTELATVRGSGPEVEIFVGAHRVRVAEDPPDWFAVRELRAGDLTVRLDDVDPYRGMNVPVPAKRIDSDEVTIWQELLDDAWRLIRECLPEFASGLAEGMCSIVPRPPVPFRNMSGSTGNAMGSAVVSRPPDAESLAAVLVHEFSHLRLYGLLRLVPLHDNDSRQRFRTLWRDDPRPVGGVIHGMYSFFAVAAFWRAFVEKHPDNRLAMFEFAYWRAGTWNTLQALRDDVSLTAAGRRLVEGVADELGPWQKETVPADIARLAEVAAVDHYAGWRLRHIRPHETLVADLAKAWISGEDTVKPVQLPQDSEPTRDPDGDWPGARLDLARLALTETIADRWAAVPGATEADRAFVSGDLSRAAEGYRAELTRDPDNASAWIGLGLALTAQDLPGGRALLQHPELVRAVRRRTAAEPAELAEWIEEITS